MSVTATKTAAVAARTEYRRQQQKAAPTVSRRCRRRRSAFVVRTVACVIGTLFAIGYIGLYAQVTLYGYHKADVAKQTRQAETENQALRAEVQLLSNPERLSAIATNAGMQPSTDVMYVTTPGKVKVAKVD